MLKNTLFTFSLLLLGSAMFAQVASQSAPAPDPIFESVEKMPAYKGGTEAINKFIAENQRPLNCDVQSLTSTKVVLKFVVEKDGRVTNTRCLGAPNIALEEEAVVLLKKLGRWMPGEQGGERVRTYITLPMELVRK